ncbi:MAG: GxxExxY protein [Actinomycetota bacterium]
MRPTRSRTEFDRITRKVIGCAYTVANELGCGFLEKVYENALAHEVRKAGLTVLTQKEINVYYDGVLVGAYVADLVVEDCVLVELKAVKAFDEIHMAQCMNYLKATGFEICLLINFGASRVEVKRIVRGF